MMIPAILAVIYERVNGHEIPVLEAFVPTDRPGGKVMFTDSAAAERLGLRDIKIRLREGGVVTPEHGERFVRALWRAFMGNSYITCDPATEGHVHVPEHAGAKGA